MLVLLSCQQTHKAHDAAGVATVGIPGPPDPAVNAVVLAVRRIAHVVHVFDEVVHLLRTCNAGVSIQSAMHRMAEPLIAAEHRCSGGPPLEGSYRSSGAVHHAIPRHVPNSRKRHLQLQLHAACGCTAASAIAQAATELADDDWEPLAGAIEAVPLPSAHNVVINHVLATLQDLLHKLLSQLRNGRVLL